MTREEIGSYLGLKLETVSRAFSHLQEEGVLQVEKKHIRLVDTVRLKKMLSQDRL
jgi:CRP/FNR family transcriptional regulator